MTSAAHPITAPSIRPGGGRAWLLAARPATLSAAVVPVAVGSAAAASVAGFSLWPALAALFGAICIQIATNFANDVFDFEKGADTEARLGPTRAVQAGLLSPGQMRWAMVGVFGLATVAGLYLTWVAGWPVVVIGMASIASGVAYTGGPYPLGYNGLGDVFVMVFFGFVAVCGTVYVQMGEVPSIAWLAAVPVGALATAILVVNNLRDADTDRLVGKRTLAVRFGRRSAIVEYAALLAVSYGVPGICAATGAASPWVLLPLVSAPWAVKELRFLSAHRGTALNPCLRRTALLLLAFGGLFTVGLACGAP